MKKTEWIFVLISVYLLIFYTGWVKESCNISDLLPVETNSEYALKFMYCEKYLGYLEPGSIRTYEHTSSFVLVNDKNELLKKMSNYQSIASESEDKNPFAPKYVSSESEIILNNDDIVVYKDDNIIKVGEYDSNLLKQDKLNSVYMRQTKLSAKELNLSYNKNTKMDIYSFLAKFRIEQIFK